MRNFSATLNKFIQTLHPAHFAMVMATGIISLTFKEMGCETIAISLFNLNAVSYLLLLFLLTARAIFFWPSVLADLKAPLRAWPFLTFTVGTNTIGAQLILFSGMAVPAAMLWVLALTAWIFCIYFIIANSASWTGKPIEEIMDGATLLIVVSTESIAFLGVRLMDSFGIGNSSALFIFWLFWAAGLSAYFLIMTLLIYRMFWRRMEPRDWSAPYWICMGAAAIIILTGAEMLLHMPATVFWSNIHSATRLLTLVAWVIATGWIPYLIIMDIWKFTRINLPGALPLWVRLFPWARLAFGRRGGAHFFEPSSWGRVFPMGMYAACTLELVKATKFEFLNIIPSYWGWCALTIWALTFTGALRSVFFRTPRSSVAFAS